MLFFPAQMNHPVHLFEDERLYLVFFHQALRFFPSPHLTDIWWSIRHFLSNASSVFHRSLCNPHIFSADDAVSALLV